VCQAEARPLVRHRAVGEVLDRRTQLRKRVLLHDLSWAADREQV